MTTASKKTTVCITGATGFVGSHLLKRLQNNSNLNVVALSRKLDPQMNGAKKDNVTWRRCDGFSLLDVEEATKDVDILIYLIHSMLPSSSLTQGTFAEFDLYLADNFARSAYKNKVKKIIYLSGLNPKTETLSPHLKSRLEVEKSLSQFDNSVTSLRAGLIVGKGGSSFKILERLCRRLPFSVCPSWTLSKTQPIDLNDVLGYLEYCVDNFKSLAAFYDIGGPDVLTYKEMLLQTAKVLGKKRYIINVPFVSPWLSRFWISLVTDSPKNLVYPLIESLKHNMIANPKHQLSVSTVAPTPFVESLRQGLHLDSVPWSRITINYAGRLNFQWLKSVTSLQRIARPKELPSYADTYFNWVTSFLSPIIKVTKPAPNKVRFLLFNKILLLKLKRSPERSQNNREVFYITGGLLAKRTTLNGRLEFRTVPASKCLLVALINFRPSLPWFIYKYTQAPIHAFVMARFRKFTQKKYNL